MSTTHDSHPSRDQLAALSEGRLTGKEILEVENHVATCEVCADTLGEMGAGDQLLARLRSAVADDPDKTCVSSSNQQAELQILKFLEPTAREGSLGRLGHYDVLECLGRGAFGIVLKAFDDSLQRVVAVKVLAPEIAATSPARKRFLREARTAAQVRHQNVVQIYAVEEQPLPYLVMEYIPGETLQHRLNQHGPLDVLEALRLGHEIARGLAAAHEQGLIHRDIKPGNILLEKGLEERVKISDFGLARAVDDASLTQSGIIAGTPMFMAPEQALGEPIDQRADLFSLGSVLYTMVSGRPPFRASGTVAVLKRVCDDTPRPIPEIIPETPQWLCDIISKLHAKRPEDRFASARDVADLLGHCLTELQQQKVPSVPSLGPSEPQGASRGSLAKAPAIPRQETRDRLQHETVSGTALAAGSTPSPTPAPAAASERSATPAPAAASTRSPKPAASALPLKESARPASARSASLRNRRLVIAAAALLVLLCGLTLTEATGVTQFAATIIRIATGEGTLVIETQDPGVKITIDGEEVSITGAGVEELKLRPGKYKVGATKDGQPIPLPRDLVSIARGGREVVRVTLEGSATSRLGTLARPDAVASRLGTPARPNPVATADDATKTPLQSGKSAQPTTQPQPALAGPSTLDALDPSQIPAAERFDWQPKELVAVLGEHRQRHWNSHLALAMHPDGKLVVSGDLDGALRFWDLATQRELFTLGTKWDYVNGLTFSGDGKILVSGHHSSVFAIWHVNGTEVKLRRTVDAGTRVGSVALTHDARTLACQASDLAVQLWDLTGAEPKRTATISKVNLGSFSPDGRTLALAHYEDQTARLYDMTVSPPRERMTLSGNEGKLAMHRDYPVPPVFLPDGTLATFNPKVGENAWAATLRLWDVQGAEVKTLGSVHGVSSGDHAGNHQVVFAKNMTMAAVDRTGMLAIWAWENPGFRKRTLVDSGRYVDLAHGSLNDMVLSPDGKVLVTGHHNGAVRFWNVAGPEPEELSPVNPQPTIFAYARGAYGEVLPSGPSIVLQSERGTRLWNLAGPVPQECQVPGDSFQEAARMAVSADGRTLLTTPAREQPTVRLWDVQEHEVKELLNFKASGRTVVSAALGPNRTTLALGDHEGRITLWDLSPELKLRATVEGQKGNVFFLAFTPDGSTLVSSEDGGLRVWDVTATGLTERAKIAADYPTLSLSPDGKTLAVGDYAGSGGGVQIWDLDGATLTQRAVIPMGVTSLAFAPDGKTLATADLGGGLAVRELTNGRALRRWKLPGLVRRLFFAPDGRHLITCNANGTVYILRLPPSPASLAPVDPDLAVAEWLFGLGWSPNGWTSIDQLPKGDFFLQHISFDSITKASEVRDADLDRLATLTRLNVLYLGAAPITDKGLARVREMSTLRVFESGSPHITDAGLRHLWELRNLERLSLRSPHITDEGLKVLRDLPNLVEIDLKHGPRNKITGTGFVHVQPPKKLKVAELHDCPLTDAGLEQIAQCENLESLCITSSDVTDSGVQHLVRLKNLRGLVLHCPNVTDAALTSLTGIKSLDALDLRETKTSAAGLQQLQSLPNLRVLHVAGTAWNDASLEYLKPLKSLKVLGVFNTEVTGAGVAELHKALPNLADFRFQGTPLDDASLEHLKALKALKYLDLRGTKVTAAGVAELHKALPQCIIDSAYGAFQPTAAP